MSADLTETWDQPRCMPGWNRAGERGDASRVRAACRAAHHRGERCCRVCRELRLAARALGEEEFEAGELVGRAEAVHQASGTSIYDRPCAYDHHPWAVYEIHE